MAACFFNSLPSKKHVSLQMNNLLIIGHIKCPSALAGMWTASHGLYGFSFPMTSKCTLLNFPFKTEVITGADGTHNLKAAS